MWHPLKRPRNGRSLRSSSKKAKTRDCTDEAQVVAKVRKLSVQRGRDPLGLYREALRCAQWTEPEGALLFFWGAGLVMFSIFFLPRTSTVLDMGPRCIQTLGQKVTRKCQGTLARFTSSTGPKYSPSLSRSSWRSSHVRFHFSISQFVIEGMAESSSECLEELLKYESRNAGFLSDIDFVCLPKFSWYATRKRSPRI